MSVSDKLRDALERLDQAIDRLDARVSDGSGAVTAPAGGPDTTAIADALDKMIRRIETVLAD